MLPGGPLQIAWPDQRGSVLMTGPAVALFDGVFSPELMPDGLYLNQDPVVSEPPSAKPNAGSDQTLDPEVEAASQKQVQAFLESTSLDSMLQLASETLEQRTRARFERGNP